MNVCAVAGKGKFSTVYRAVKRASGEVVALKRVHIADIMDQKKREKTLKEVRRAEQTRGVRKHPQTHRVACSPL